MSGSGHLDVAADVAEFRALLKTGLSPLQIVQQEITTGNSRIVSNGRYQKLREHFAGAFGVSPSRDVLMVGSAKLGFSIKPKRRYQPFGNESDVDVAIVSPQLYGRLWAEVRECRSARVQWDSVDNLNHLKNDHLAGVIKPYLLPTSRVAPSKGLMFDLCAEIQRLDIVEVPVTLAVWYDIDCLEAYQCRAVRECQAEEA